MKKIKDFAIILASLSIFAASTTYILQVIKISSLEQELKDLIKENKKKAKSSKSIKSSRKKY